MQGKCSQQSKLGVINETIVATCVTNIVHHMGCQWTSPSTPPCFSSNKEAAKVLAAAQLKMAPHLTLHACSARLLRMGGSDLAFALAKRDKNLRVSSDQRPPISPARTTRRALRRGPTNSGSSPYDVWLPLKTAPSSLAARG